MTKTIALLGATGSIGRQTLEVAVELGLRVAALTANTQVDLLEQQARQYMPRLAVLYDENAALALKKRLRGTGIEVMAGEEGLLAAAAMTEADTVVTAVMGSVGLRPTLAAIQKGKRIALANKETLVCEALPGLYPCGEGAGYAGGIMTAAVDGVRCAAELMKRYKPCE